MEQVVDEQLEKFKYDLQSLINSCGIDNRYNIPDYILAEYFCGTLYDLGLLLYKMNKHSAQVDKQID